MSSKKPAISPFNFVSLPVKAIVRYQSSEELPIHNKIYSGKEGYYSGEISYKFKAESPVFVSAGNMKKNQKCSKEMPLEFFKNSEGKYAIPGNSISGLLRTNIQILGMCNPKDDIYNSHFLYRDWTSTDRELKKHYKSEIDLKPEFGMPGKVKAGYLYKAAENKYFIIPAKHHKGKTFYNVSEQMVRKVFGEHDEINYMYNESLLEADKSQWKEEYGDKWQKQWKKHIKEIQNKSPKPYYMKESKVGFNTTEQGGLTGLSDLTENTAYTGILLCSGFVQGKMAHYVIHDCGDQASEIKVPTESIRAYEDDLEWKKQKDEFYKIPQKIGTENKKPVFYVEGEKGIYFGMTPYLRILHKNNVHAGIPENLEINGINYADAIFGFSKEDNKYKSRVFCEDAAAVEEIKIDEVQQLILGEPKASCYPEYLCQPQEGKLVSYSDDFTIRGIKQYWLQDKTQKSQVNAKNNVSTYFRPLHEGVVFSGKIHYKNLQADELGLLLYALYITEGAYQNIGMAKPYGYGKLKLLAEELQVKNYNYENLYSSLKLDEEAYETIKFEKMIDKYKKYIRDHFEIDIEQQKNVKEFICMKTTSLKEDYVKYAEVGSDQFKNKAVLPCSMEYEQTIKTYLKNQLNTNKKIEQAIVENYDRYGNLIIRLQDNSKGRILENKLRGKKRFWKGTTIQVRFIDSKQGKNGKEYMNYELM